MTPLPEPPPETPVPAEPECDLRGEKGFTPDPIETAQEFSRRLASENVERDYQLRSYQERLAAEGAATRVWATVVALVLLGILALIAFAIYSITSEHRDAKIAHERADQHKVTAWCYADPNSDRSTSQVTGSPEDVRGYCPDARVVSP